MGSKLGFGLVRGPDGKPKFDGDPKDAHPGVLMMLTNEERAELGLWDGPMARDAEGTKRLERVSPGEFRAVDDLVAVTEIVDGVTYYRVVPRADIAAGETFTVKQEK